MKLSKREMMLLFVLGAVAIVFIGVNYLVMPLFTTNKELNETLSGLNDQLLTLQTDQQTAGAIDGQIQKEMDKTTALSAPFSQSIRREQVSHWLNSLLNANNLNMYSIDFTDVVSAAPSYDTDRSVPPDGNIDLPIQNAADIAGGKTEPQPTETPADAAASGDAPAAAAEGAQTAAPPETYCTQVVLNATGSYADIVKLMDAIYADGRSLVVDGLSINDYKDGDMIAMVSMRFFGAPLPDGVEDQSYAFPAPAGQGSLMKENTAPQPSPAESQEP